MPIQFRCSHCEQPIEVDDEHAGKTAACPYCRSTISVPAESNYDPRRAVVARPLAPQAPLPLSALAGPGMPDRTRALQWGRRALLLALVALGLLIFEVVRLSIPVVQVVRRELDAGAPTSQAIEAAQKAQRETLKNPDVVSQGVSPGMTLLSFVALALGAHSLARGGKNWRAITAVIISSLFVSCWCSMIFLQMALPGAR
jgi:DNA-directed RNA polymerase subunit RPC12/RpoP